VRIDRIDFHFADAGWKEHGFVKVTTLDGTAGWAEFSPQFGGGLVAAPPFGLAAGLIGREIGSAETNGFLRPRGERTHAVQQLLGALDNAVLDVRARALGIPVHELLGGALRDQVRLYWAHCGTYRVTHADLIGQSALRSLDDVTALGREVRRRGFTALKTNILLLSDGQPRRYRPGPEARAADRADPAALAALHDQLAALRAGTGADVELMVDIGAGHGVGAAAEFAAEAKRFDVPWLEVEGMDATRTAALRGSSPVPVATGERLRPDEVLPYLRGRAADVIVIDVPFNGVRQAVRTAAVCEAFGTEVAPHNCYGPLATMMSAAFCAVVPNLRVMEIDVDAVAWESDFVTRQPAIAGGSLCLTTEPGWGTEVSEAALAAHRTREPVTFG
jgi:galactonate dehydratase